MFFRVKRTRGVDYLQLVANERAGAQVRQKVLASLGRLEDLRASGALDRLVGAGVALSDKALLLVPPLPAATIEHVGDEALRSSLFEAAACQSPHSDVLSAFCQADPGGLRRLVRAVVFDGLSAAASKDDMQALLRLGGHGREAPDGGETTVLALTRAMANGSDLLLGVRMAAGAGKASLMRGLVTCLAMTLDGTPVATGHWSAHHPPLKTVVDVAADLGGRLGTNQLTVVFDRAFGGEAFLSAVTKLHLDFVIPLRESAGRLGVSGAANWACHEVRPPRGREGGEVGAGASGLRFIQIVDPSAVERDWRLRSTQLARLQGMMAGMGPGSAGPVMSRLHAMRGELVESERWDGTTLLATNLKLAPQEIAQRYAADVAVQAWEAEMTAFGQRILDADVALRDTEALLSGGAAVTLMASLMRHGLAQLLSEKLGRRCSWDEVKAALAEYRTVRISQEGRTVTLSPEVPAALQALLAAVGIEANAGPKRRSGAKRSGRPAAEA